MSKKNRNQNRSDDSGVTERPQGPPPSDDPPAKPKAPAVKAAPSNVVTLADREFTVNIFIRSQPGELPKAFAITEKATNGMKKRTMKQWADRYAAWLAAPR